MNNHSKSLYNYGKTYTNHSGSLRNKKYMIGTLISKVTKFPNHCIKYLIFLHVFIYFDIVNLGYKKISAYRRRIKLPKVDTSF